jgi:hypothetical protein
MAADPSDLPILRLLEPDEQLRAQAEAAEAKLLVTDKRVAVATNDRLALAVPFEAVRRIQFDIEPDRRVRLVLVPDRADDEPQVLTIPPSQYEAVSDALAFIHERIGGRLERMSVRWPPSMLRRLV